MRAAFFAALFLPCLAGAAAGHEVLLQSFGISATSECAEAADRPASPAHDHAALAVCSRALSEGRDASNAERALTLSNRAAIELRLQDFQSAMTDGDAAATLQPNLAAAWLNRGGGLLGLGRYDEARASLDKAIALGVAAPERAYYGRGMADEKLGEVKSAYLDYRKALALNPRFQVAADELTRFHVTARHGD